MPVLIVSALVWLFVMYIVVPIFQVIAVIWPFILGGIGVFIAVVIYRALNDGNDSASENEGDVRSNHDYKFPPTFREPGSTRNFANRRNEGASYQTWSSGQDALTSARKTFNPRLEHGLSTEAAATIAALSMPGARGINKNAQPEGSKPNASSSENGVGRQRKSSLNSRVLNAPPGVPTRGLIIMEEPLNKILQGRKTMELRTKHNRQLGLIALIKKGSGKIYGIAEIEESIGPMSFDEFRARAHEHAVEPDRLREVFEMGWNHGWRLRNVVPLKSPVSYIHTPGAVIQVKLDPAAIDALGKQLNRV